MSVLTDQFLPHKVRHYALCTGKIDWYVCLYRSYSPEACRTIWRGETRNKNHHTCPLQIFGIIHSMQEVFIKTVVSDSEDVFCYINKHVEPVNIVELKDPESVSIDILLHCNMAITYSLSINI